MGVVQATLMLFLIFFGLMFMGVPISVSIGFASISILFTGFDLDALAYIVAQRCFSGIDFVWSACSAVLHAGRQHHEQGRHCSPTGPSGPLLCG